MEADDGKSEYRIVRTLFTHLVHSELHAFPARGRVCEPPGRGVYVIYGPRGRPLHVGRTPRARGGLAQRLTNHLRGRSSFVRERFEGDGSRLRRRGYGFRCLEVGNARRSALLEAYAVGRLCPAHLGAN